MDLQATFPSNSLRQGPTNGPSGKFSSQFFVPRSGQWTFRQVFRPILCAKVQPMDLPASFRPDFLRQGPADGPSGKFSAPFFAQGPTCGPSSNFSIQFLAPRSSRWTFRQVFRPVFCAKVQPMDLPVSFRPDFLRQGPANGPSGNAVKGLKVQVTLKTEGWGGSAADADEPAGAKVCFEGTP